MLGPGKTQDQVRETDLKGERLKVGEPPIRPNQVLSEGGG